MRRHLAALSALALTVVALGPSATTTAWGGDGHARVPTCHGHRATIVGTRGPDHLVGTPHRDVIVGLGGNDRIGGRGGDDILCGNGSRDRLLGGRGNDLLDGGTSDDRLFGGVGDDRVYGGPGLGDKFQADPGNDTWVTGTATSADDARDTFFYWPNGRGVTVDLPHGRAFGTGIGHDTLLIADLAHGVKTVLSSEGDTLISGPGRDEISDTTGGGDDRIDAGAGDDRVFYMDSRSWVVSRSTIVLGLGNDTLYDADGSTRVRGGPGDDHVSIRTTSVDDTFGYGEADVRGGPGNDRLHVNADSGDISGDAGDDRLVVAWSDGHQEVAVSGDDGTDTVQLAPHDTAHPGDTFALDLGGGTAGWSSQTPVAMTGVENALVHFAGDSDASVVMRGTEGPNRLWFLPSAPTVTDPVQIFGLGDDDSLMGGNGDDLLDGGAGQDAGSGGEGNDTCVSIEGPIEIGQPTCEIDQP